MSHRSLSILALMTALALPVGRAAAAAADHPAETPTASTATSAAHEEHGTTHDEEEQLTAVNFKQAIWVAVIFLIVLVILYPTAWKNVLAGLKAREQGIRANIAEAEAARAKAEATLRDYNTQLATAEGKVREMLAAATADAERMAAQIRARGEHEATEAKDRATKEIEAASRQAIAQVYEQTAQLATSVAEKILRRSINADDQRDLVTRSLDQVGNIKNN